MPNELGPIQDHFAQAQPNLGYGKQTEASIDAVNQWMRSTPWWQQIAGQGGHLSKQQRQMILRQAQANGVVVDEGDMEIDPAGNFNPRGHKLRNTLIVAGIAGATLATMGAAGAFAGAGAGAGAGSAGAAAPLASTTIGTGMLGPIAGGTGLAGAGAGAAGAGAAGAGTLAATQIGSGAMGPIAGGTSGAGMLGGAAGGAGGLGQSIARHIGTVGEDVAKDSFKHQLAGALATLGGAGVGHLLGGGGQSSVPPELQQLLAMSMKQQQDLDPLRQNVTQGVNAMLPTFAKGR